MVREKRKKGGRIEEERDFHHLSSSHLLHPSLVIVPIYLAAGPTTLPRRPVVLVC